MLSKGKDLNEGIKQVGFVILLVFAFYVIIGNLSYFFSSILGAFTLYMICRSPLRKLQSKGVSSVWATSILLTIIVILVFIIGGALVGTVYTKLKDFHPQSMMQNMDNIHQFIYDKTGYDVFSKEMINKGIATVSNFLPNIFSITGSIVTNALMMIFVLFFMLKSSHEMEAGIVRNMPVSEDSITLLKKEVKSMILSNAIGLPVIMIGQAVISGLIYWWLGAGDPFVFGILTGIVGLVPVVGTAGVWGILAVTLFIDHQIWSGILLLLMGSLVISNVDNVVRIVLMQKQANVHPLITIFGVLLGMNLFGFWGIIFGPLIISGSLVMIKIYKNEFLQD